MPFGETRPLLRHGSGSITAWNGAPLEATLITESAAILRRGIPTADYLLYVDARIRSG
jgi:hypothetical protein